MLLSKYERHYLNSQNLKYVSPRLTGSISINNGRETEGNGWNLCLTHTLADLHETDSILRHFRYKLTNKNSSYGEDIHLNLRSHSRNDGSFR